MRDYIIRRILLIIPTVFLVTLFVFIGIRLIPGNIVDHIVASFQFFEEMDRIELEKSLGLDQPIHVQYFRYMGGLLRGDLGNSMLRQTPVLDLILERWPVTIELGLMGLLIGQLIAIPVGILSAIRQDTLSDYVGRSFAILAMAVPNFWLGTLIVVFPSMWWGYMPPIMAVPFFEDPLRNLETFILPAVVLGMAMMGTTMRLTRAQMLEVLRQDYIRTAWAKGLRERVVVVRHALKNALIPIISLIGLRLPVLIGGTVIIERIFTLPGLGRLIVEAANFRDYSILSGVLLFFAGFMVIANLLVDLTYSFVDPRIVYK